MIIMRRLFANRYFIINKNIESGHARQMDTDVVAITAPDLVAFCKNGNYVLEAPPGPIHDHFDNTIHHFKNYSSTKPIYEERTE